MVKQYKSAFWKTHHPVSTIINWFDLPVEEDIANQPIFILDEDPVICARALTTEHLKEYMRYIIYSSIVFYGDKKAISESKALEHPRVDYMFYNQRTAYWFFKLYEEAQKIYKKKFGTIFQVTNHFKKSWVNYLQPIKGPSDVKLKGYKGIRLPRDQAMIIKYRSRFTSYMENIYRAPSRIDRFKIMYMLLDFLYSEFPAGAPAWYQNLQATIWHSYNKMTKLYYRIDTSIEGIYSYYYSADDKNWVKIENIPNELRWLIDGIIFARDV